MQPACRQLRTSLLDSLERQRHQLAEGWERDRREWRANVRTIGENWRSELGAELERTRAEMAHELEHSTARRRAADLYMALPCVPSLFPGKGAHIIVDTLKTRAEALGPLKAAAMQRDGDVCSICLEPMQAGEQAIALPCHHIFHWACLCPWIERKGAGAECPFCKRGICPELSKENKWAVAAVQQHQRQRARERLRDRTRFDLLRSRQLESQDTLGTTMMVSEGSAAASRSAVENSLVLTAAPREEAGLHPLGASIGSALESADGVETVYASMERTQSQLPAGRRPSFIERRRHQQMHRWSETTQRQPTRFVRNLERLAQEFLPPPTHPHTNPSAQSQAMVREHTPLDLRVSGSLDIDYHWTLEEGRRMTAAAQIVQLTNEMRDDIPR